MKPIGESRNAIKGTHFGVDLPEINEELTDLNPVKTLYFSMPGLSS